MSIANVSLLEALFLFLERCPGIRSIIYVKTVSHTSQLVVLDNLNRVRFWRFVDAISPSIVLASKVSIDSYLSGMSIAFAICIGLSFIMVVLDPIFNMGREITQSEEVFFKLIRWHNI